VPEARGRTEVVDSGVDLERFRELPAPNGDTRYLHVGSLTPRKNVLRLAHAFERLGSSRTVHVNVRVVAATHRDLLALVHQQQFRADLYYRLHVFPLTVPPLRERREDIPLLVRHFAQQYAHELHKDSVHIPAEAMAALVRYDWPGNVRELENVMKRSCTMAAGDVLTPESLPPYIPSGMTPLDRGGTEDSTSLADRDRQYILEMLDKEQWNISRAARVLGIHRATLYRRLLSMGFKPESLRQDRAE